MAKTTQTLTITNFSGRLTRILNGDLNSGFAKFTPSWGFDPFSKPMNLTWLEKPTDITGPISGLPLAGKTTENSGISDAQVFIYDLNSKIYGIASNTITNANVNSVVSIGSIRAGRSDPLFPVSMDFYGNTLQVYIGSEYGVNRANFDGSSDTFVGNATRYYGSYRPLKQFNGALFFGNGKTIGKIDAAGTITSPVASVAGSSAVYSSLNPPLPRESLIQDLDVSLDGNYLLITGANKQAIERVDSVAVDVNNSLATEGAIFKWNGSDQTITAMTSTPSYWPQALQTFLGNNLFFANDNFGSSLNDETKKILMLPNNKAPLPSATCTNGNFLTWWCREIIGTKSYATLYYYGSLDSENQPGLYRVLRWETTQASANVFMPSLNVLVGNAYKTINGSSAVVTRGYGKHYLGVNSRGISTYQSFLLSFLITPTGDGTPNLGVYETQTQLFSKRIGLSQIRVYTESVVAGNGFQLDIIDTDGNVMSNGTFTYSYGDPIDKNMRINFNPNSQTMYGLGIRITNMGTTNMTIKKIEIDYTEEGK